MKPRMPQFSTDRHALFRIAEPERRNLEKLLFRRHPRREWGTFFRFGFRRTRWGLALSYVDPLPPVPGDLDRSSPVVEFRASYVNRALRECEARLFGIGVIHSHPQTSLTFGASPSPSDDDMDLYFAELFQTFSGGRPYCSLILNQTGTGALYFTGRAYDADHWMPVNAILCPGFPLARTTNALLDHGQSAPADANHCAESVTDRLDQLVTAEGRRRLASACVGIIGCSGTGSPAIEALARAQIGEFVIVDCQQFAPSNLERMHGSRYADVLADPKPSKVELMARLIWEVNPTASITAIVGNLLDPEVKDELLRCDLLLGCTDTYHGRAALGDLATHYLVPSIDVGVLMKGRNQTVTTQMVELTRYTPHEPCPFCSGCINNWWLAWELMDTDERERRRAAAQEAARRGDNPDLYWGGDEPQLPTVGYLTTHAGSLAAGYAINWIVGTADTPHSHFQYDVGAPQFGFVFIPRTRKAECACGRTIGHADQAEMSVTRPMHWPMSSRPDLSNVRPLDTSNRVFPAT
ncbi:MAG: hypothetical protein PCFJNLEI_01107 [Verrucomicrobiae bacterium]|nr:hypothetical protein [Verrucomicrobiae bacterium]